MTTTTADVSLHGNAYEVSGIDYLDALVADQDAAPRGGVTYRLVNRDQPPDPETEQPR